MENDVKRNEKYQFNSRLISSAHLNFFFGAGVNGRAICQMNDLKETVKLIEDKLEKKLDNFEKDLLCLSEEHKQEVLEIFLDELGGSINKFDINHEDLNDFSNMLASFNKLIVNSENRTKTMKRVNIYTTNYDDVIERLLNKLGYLCNVISSSNLENKDKFFDLIGYDYGKEIFLPTYLISKIHGDLENPILPTKNKFDETLQRKRFEILFRMKSQLSKKNSILFVIGYSGNDEHLNSLIYDAISFGLTVFWFKYDNDEIIPSLLEHKVITINQEDNDNKKNPTLICSEMIGELWENLLEE